MINNRPYSFNNPEDLRQVIRLSPDAIVLFNGEPTFPGCGGCPRRIDFQSFITTISAGAGVTPDAGNASIEMSIPYNFGNSWIESSTPVIRHGMEVHIFSKGYFATESPPDASEEGLNQIPTNPYYPIFHGVVTGLSTSQSGGFYTVSMECSTMLHFWNHFRLVSNPSFLGNRPNNTRVASNYRGNLFNGMSPYAIIYELYRRDVGDPSGIDFALRQTDNFDARTDNPDAGFNYFSESVQAYWERRFRQRPYNLRMYGISGRLFNTLQQTFLGIDNSTTQSIINRITRRLNQANPPEPRDVLQRRMANLSLLRRDSNGRVVGDLDVYVDNLTSFSSQSGGEVNFDFNIAAIDPFVQDLGGYGNVAMFNTEDLSKLEIASTVTESVGFEFYQDVDGDLVFKPPFYNLNTAPSRVYVVKPVEIINFSFSEAEPEATYCVATNPYFQNFNGTSVEGEWGNRAVYIDWRLVAQYGWRSTDLQTSFYNNPNVLYYMAAHHLDITNAKSMHTASLTIPHRPELRPGYPIYIEHLDTYYYITGIDHSISYGADCTTSLTLCARRRPFHAPGTTGEGVSSINLKNTELPPKPLTTLQPDGTIRTTGFPNVVLSLDPEQITPSFFITGADVSSLDLTNPESLPILIRQALAANLISVAPGGTLAEGPYQVQSQRGPVVLGDLGQIQSTIADGLLEINQGSFTPTSGVPFSVEVLASLLNQVKVQLRQGIPDPRSAEGVLSLLMEQKASFSPNVPGRYRYYSASHPDPDMQGMRRLDARTGEIYRTGSLYLIQQGFSRPKMFAQVPSNIPQHADPRTFAEFTNTFPQAGLNILRYAGGTPEVIPTSEILSLAFAKQRITLDSAVAVQTPVPFQFNRNTRTLTRNIKRYISNLVSPDPQRSLFEILIPVFEYIGPLEITGEVVTPFTDEETDSISDFLLQDYADSLGVSVETAFQNALDRQARILANQINRLYDQEFSVFKTSPDTASPDQFREIVSKYQKDTSIIGGVPIGNVPSFTNFFTPREATRNYTVPVFPVSDADGYEVIGSFPYGRGLRVEPGASFSQILEQDPLTFADRSAVQDYVRSILRSEDGNPSSDAEEALFASLEASDPAMQTLLRYVPKSVDTSDRTEVLRQGLANFQASDSSGFSKLTIANAARSLGNIMPAEEMNRPCACSATDSDIYLESFLNNPDLFTTIENPAGRVSEWMRKKAEEASEPHKLRQQALRSDAPLSDADNLPLYNPSFDPNINILDAARTAVGTLRQNVDNTAQQLRIQRDQARAIQSIRDRRRILDGDE